MMAAQTGLCWRVRALASGTCPLPDDGLFPQIPLPFYSPSQEQQLIPGALPSACAPGNGRPSGKHANCPIQNAARPFLLASSPSPEP